MTCRVLALRLIGNKFPTLQPFPVSALFDLRSDVHGPGLRKHFAAFPPPRLLAPDALGGHGAGNAGKRSGPLCGFTPVLAGRGTVGVMTVVGGPSPTGDTLLLVRPVLYPPIADLAQPMLRLAALRIDPTTNGEHHSLYWTDLSLRKMANGSEMKIELPPGARPNYFYWSADRKWVAFPNGQGD